MKALFTHSNNTSEFESFIKYEHSAVTVKSSILTLVKFIEDERTLFKHSLKSSVHLARTLSTAAKDSLNSTIYRFDEINTLLHVQNIKRFSIKYNEDLRRAYCNSKIQSSRDPKVQKFLTQPEHFQRQTMGKTANKASLSWNDSRVSPWEGSDYKHALVESLRSKLLLKLVFQALAYNRDFNNINKQVIVSSMRTRQKRLVQLCFSSLAFEALSSRYITISSAQKTRRHLMNKLLKPVLHLLAAMHRGRLLNNANALKASSTRREQQLRRGLDLLRWNWRYCRRLRQLKRWATRTRATSSLLKAFLSWTHAFVLANQVRVDLQRRLTGVTLNDTTCSKFGHSVRSSVKASHQKASHITPHRSDRHQQTERSAKVAMGSAMHEFVMLRIQRMAETLTAVDGDALDSSSFSVFSVDSLSSDTLLNSHSARARNTVHSTIRTPVPYSSRQSHSQELLSPLLPPSLLTTLHASFSAKKQFPGNRFLSQRGDGGKADTSASRTRRARNGLNDERGRSGRWTDSALRSSPEISLWKRNAVESFNSFCSDDEIENDSATDDSSSMMDHMRSGYVQHSSPHTGSHFSGGNTSVLESALEISAMQKDSEGLSAEGLSAAGPVQSRTASATVTERAVNNCSFCGSVEEMDSDFERELRGLVGWERDRAVDRRERFVQELRSQFRLLKFDWIIRTARRFVRSLRRQTRLHTAFRDARRLHLRWVKKVQLRAWRAVMCKYQQQYALCLRIYTVKFSRKVLVAWREYAVLRVAKARARVVTMSRRRATTRIFGLWSGLFHQRQRQMRVDRAAQLLFLRRVWRAWLAFQLHQRRIRQFCTEQRNETLHAVFALWIEKYNRRKLLRRVFYVHEVAWAHRRYHSTHHFDLLHRVFGSWAAHVRETKSILRQEEALRKALCFRGVSLMVRFFFAWTDSTAVVRRRKAFAERRKRRVLALFFEDWRKAAVRETEWHPAVDGASEKKVLHKAVSGWKLAVSHEEKDPERLSPLAVEHKSSHLLQWCFTAWRCARLQRLVSENRNREIQLRWFSFWRRLRAMSIGVTRGCQRLCAVMLRWKLRRAFTAWPGRAECIKARLMREYVMRKGRSRIRLVDAEPGETNKNEGEYATQSRRIKSFVAPKRMTIVERSVQHGFVRGSDDCEGLSHILTLLSCVLSSWRLLIERNKHYHRLSLKLRVFTKEHALTNCLRHWIAVTPLTACRVVTWIHKRQSRLHEEHQYLQKSEILRKEYQQGKLSSEVDKSLRLTQ